MRFLDFQLVPYLESKKFGFNKENRCISECHLRKIKNQCIDHFEMMPPITVNRNTNNVIDGQHRLVAYQFLIENKKLPEDTTIKVMFVEMPSEEEKWSVINANVNSKGWAINDYIKSHIASGLRYYKFLEEWCDKHSLCFVYEKDRKTNEQKKKYFYRAGVAIILGKKNTDIIKKGLLSFNDEQINVANKIHDELVEIINALGIENEIRVIEPFAAMWHKYRLMHPFDIWLKEFKAMKRYLLEIPKGNMNNWKIILDAVHGSIDKKGLK